MAAISEAVAFWRYGGDGIGGSTQHCVFGFGWLPFRRLCAMRPVRARLPPLMPRRAQGGKRGRHAGHLRAPVWPAHPLAAKGRHHKGHKSARGAAGYIQPGARAG